MEFQPMTSAIQVLYQLSYQASWELVTRLIAQISISQLHKLCTQLE